MTKSYIIIEVPPANSTVKEQSHASCADMFRRRCPSELCYCMASGIPYGASPYLLQLGAEHVSR